MRSLKREYYTNGLINGCWYKVKQDDVVWIFRLYHWDEIKHFIFTYGGCFTLNENDKILNYFPSNYTDLNGIKCCRWGILESLINIRKIKFSEVKVILEKNGYNI